MDPKNGRGEYLKVQKGEIEGRTFLDNGILSGVIEVQGQITRGCRMYAVYMCIHVAVAKFCWITLSRFISVHVCISSLLPSFTVYLNQKLNLCTGSLCCQKFFILIQNIDPPSFFSFIYREMLHFIFIPISSLLGRLKVRVVSYWMNYNRVTKILFQVFSFRPITLQGEVGIWLPLLWFIYT